jgi:hypothetical protein
MGVVANNEEPLVTRREFELNHAHHAREHEEASKNVKTALDAVDKMSAVHTESHTREHTAHEREHELHSKFHDTEHIMTQTALEKADSTLEKRLTEMNQFREQLERQAGSFITRTTFDDFVKERNDKLDTAIRTIVEKYDSLLNAVVSRHDSDIGAIREQLQSEREYRKSFEGSMNTWKWIASFLGASGVAGVIILFITRFAQ